MEKLKFYNDSNFKFDPEKHAYTHGDDTLISVTQFISRFHDKFDQDFWSKKKALERGVSQEVILNEWKFENDKANFIGTYTHEWIENYFNEKWQNLPSDPNLIDRINKFNKIYSTHLYKLTPVKFEQRIFSKKYKIAGTVDSLFLYKDSLVIVDWKTNKNFKTNDDWKLLYPFEDLSKCHLNEYSIQISLYSLILKEIGLDVKVGYLVHIGPNSDAIIHRCLDLTKRLEDYLKDNPL